MLAYAETGKICTIRVGTFNDMSQAIPREGFADQKRFGLTLQGIALSIYLIANRAADSRC